VTSAVLDASALLAVLNSEPGADVVAAFLHDAIISAVNYSEVLKKTIERNGSPEQVAHIIRDLAVAIIPFDAAQAAATAALFPEAKPFGLSLADRACLALGLQRRATVLTADSKWKLVKVSVKVKLIRNAN
jgi:PIN domain nuclease of toxin-antitoxin system